MCEKRTGKEIKDMIEKKEYEQLWNFLYENRDKIPVPFNDLFYRLRCYSAAAADGMFKNAKECLGDTLFAVMVLSEKLY